MSDDPGKHAVDVVAHFVVAEGDHGDDDHWDSYPDIGEHDWQAVLGRADAIIAGLRPTTAAYVAAYNFLASRAEATA